MRTGILTLLTFSLALGSATASAASFFADDFEASMPALDAAPAGWTVTDGTTDIVGPGLDAFLCAGSGTCVDLDGSTGDAGILQRSFTLRAGAHYVLGFDLAGNRRLSGTETGHVTFGSARLDYALADTQVDYRRFTLAWSPLTDGVYAVTFANDGGDLGGAILDNVHIEAHGGAAVDAPASITLLALGVLSLACVRRRKVRQAR